MGLDWIPMSKPKPGFEERFRQIMRIIKGEEKQNLSLIDKLKGKRLPSKDALVEEWRDNSIEAYETIKAPRVGYDATANEWIKEQYEETDKTISREQFLHDHLGYYVAELAEEQDGVSFYCSPVSDRTVFRAQFLEDCKDLSGEDLHAQAWVTKFADEALAYANQLMEIANKHAAEHNLLYLKDQQLPPETDNEESMEHKVHILYSAARWLVFYGERGHGYEADY